MISVTNLKMQKVVLAGAPGLQDTKPTSIASLFLTGKSLQYPAVFNCCLQKVTSAKVESFAYKVSDLMGREKQVTHSMIRQTPSSLNQQRIL